jgi:hypothetical protein
MTGTYRFASNGSMGGDTISPVVTISGANNNGTFTDSVTPIFSATDDVGVTSLTATLDGKPFTSGTRITALGYHRLIVTATDLAGNKTTKTIAFYVKRATTMVFKAPSTSKYASAKLYGRLYDSAGNRIAGKRVQLQYYRGGWKKLVDVTTSSTGYFYHYAKPTKRTSYRAVFSADTSYLATTSITKRVLPKVYLSRPKAAKTMSYGKAYTVYGYLKPKHKAKTYPVKLKAYRYQSGRYVYIKGYWAKAYTYTNSRGETFTKYKDSVKLPKKGKWRIRAYHPKDTKNAKTYSSYKYVTVR